MDEKKETPVCAVADMKKDLLVQMLHRHKRYILSQKGGKKMDFANFPLTGADLSYTDLENVCFSTLDCSGVNFTGANLKHTNFNCCNLPLANFTDADLRWSYMQVSDLSGANFTNADLRFATVRGSDFTGAELEGAKTFGIIKDDKTFDPVRMMANVAMAQVILGTAPDLSEI
jgi:uncharacterized protein YjbI with pentapeptide repeats